MRSCFQHGFNFLVCGRTCSFSLPDKAFQYPCPVLPVSLRHVKRIGCELIFVCAARMLRNTLPFVSELNHRLLAFSDRRQHDQSVRNGVAVTSIFSVVVWASLRGFVFRVFRGLFGNPFPVPHTKDYAKNLKTRL